MLRQKPDARVSIQYSSALNEIEGVLIQALEPRLNKQGARWQKTAIEYVQVRPDSALTLLGISKQITDLDQRIFKTFKT
jgi:hypothetical protein